MPTDPSLLTPELRSREIADGLLVYLTDTTEAQKLTALSGMANIAFYNKGKGYQSVSEAASNPSIINDQSISQVKITYGSEDHYFKRIHAVSNDPATGFKAASFIETNADGAQLKNGNLHICCGGFSGDVVKLKMQGASTPEEKATDAELNGQWNPQNNVAPGFFKDSLDKSDTMQTTSSVDIYGQSAGAGPAIAMKSYATSWMKERTVSKLKNADLMLAEPLQAERQVDLIAEKASKRDLQVAKNFPDLVPMTKEQWKAALTDKSHVTTSYGVRTENGKQVRDTVELMGFKMSAAQILGAGVGNVIEVNLDNIPRGEDSVKTAVQDHRAMTQSEALAYGAQTMAAGADKGGAPAGEAPQEFNMGNMLMQLLMGLLSGDKSVMMNLVSTLVQNMPGLEGLKMPVSDVANNGGPNAAFAGNRNPGGRGAA